jgi:hypothetical protein
MKTFYEILIVPFMTACIVVISIIAFYYLDAQKSNRLDIPPLLEDSSGKPPAASERHTPEEPIHNSPISTSRKDFVYPADGVRDPFQQVSVQAVAPPINQTIMVLAGVIWDERNPVAIITDSDRNSYVVRVGEKINKAVVLDIQPGSVTIERDGKTQELKL